MFSGLYLFARIEKNEWNKNLQCSFDSPGNGERMTTTKIEYSWYRVSVIRLSDDFFFPRVGIHLITMLFRVYRFACHCLPRHFYTLRHTNLFAVRWFHHWHYIV